MPIDFYIFETCGSATGSHHSHIISLCFSHFVSVETETQSVNLLKYKCTDTILSNYQSMVYNGHIISVFFWLSLRVGMYLCVSMCIYCVYIYIYCVYMCVCVCWCGSVSNLIAICWNRLLQMVYWINGTELSLLMDHYWCTSIHPEETMAFPMRSCGENVVSTFSLKPIR